MDDAEERGLGYRWYVVILLAILSIVSYADRLVLGILVQPIKEELGVSDTAMGFLLGFSFAMVYAVLALALARVADRWNRKRLIIIGVVIWSVMTSASAFADGFWQLAFCRLGVGIGEAALGPAALSIIADLFRQERRHVPVSMFLAAGVVGSTGAYIIGGGAILLVNSMDSTSLPIVGELSAWRLVFLFMGLPGLVLSALMILTVQEPKRRGDTSKPQATYSDIFAHLKDQVAVYFPIFAGIGVIQTVIYAIVAWFPTILVRTHEVPIADAGILYGTVGLIFGTAGAIFGPYLAGLLQRNGRDDGLHIVGFSFVALPVPFVFLTLLAPTVAIALIAVAVVLFCFMASSAMPPLLPQLVAPNAMRAQITALYYFVGNIMGLGMGPLVVGLISDNQVFGASNLNQSILVVCSILMPIALLILGFGWRTFRAGAHEAKSANRSISET
ncbi:MAG: MFS transporter [Pseudomonadota bacterium]